MKTIKKFCDQEFVFDNTKPNSKKAKIEINGEFIKIKCDDIIDTQFSAGNLDDNQLEFIKDFLNLGIYSKAPCGGFINFYIKESNKGNRYIIFSGVNEVSNSHYIVTIHKIIKE